MQAVPVHGKRRCVRTVFPSRKTEASRFVPPRPTVAGAECVAAFAPLNPSHRPVLPSRPIARLTAPSHRPVPPPRLTDPPYRPVPPLRPVPRPVSPPRLTVSSHRPVPHPVPRPVPRPVPPSRPTDPSHWGWGGMCCSLRSTKPVPPTRPTSRPTDPTAPSR